jgi:hypothetical protein
MNVPKRFRTDNFVIVFFLINRLLAHIIDYQTLLTCYQGSILLLLLSIFIMSVFIIIMCYVYNHSLYKDKLDPQAFQCVCLAYANF